MNENIIDCPHGRCAAPVFEVTLQPKLERKLLDAEPVTWDQGGRIRVPDIGITDGPPVAYRLLNPRHAFGIVRLYRPHAETCKVAQRRTTTKATSS